MIVRIKIFSENKIGEKMILRNILLCVCVLLNFLFTYSYAALCRTTNDHKNYTCNGFGLDRYTVSLSTRLALLRVRLYECRETDIKEGILYYPKLESLTISCGTINQIHKNAFANVTNLQELDLSDNSLSSFAENVFKPLQQLRTLNLSKNSFTELKQFTFNDLSNLKVLFLSYNKISDFHPKVFDQTRQVQELHLNYNEINFLPVRLLTKTRKLQHLDLSNNQIEEIGEVFILAYNLQLLNLSHNVIKDIPTRAFQTTRLEILDLSFNKLEVIYEDGLQLKTLKELYLQNNAIQLFEVGGLNMDTLPLRLLNVENNRLVFLKTDFVQATKNLETFRASRNPWDCDCWNKIETIRSKLIKNAVSEDPNEPLCVIGPVNDCKINTNNLDYYYNLYFKQFDD